MENTEDVTTPFLSNTRDHQHSQDNDEFVGVRHKPPTTVGRFIIYFMLLHFLLGFCEMIVVAPLISLFEQSLCRTYYSFPGGKIEDVLCKIPEIQAPLATIRGWKSTFDTLAGKIQFSNFCLFLHAALGHTSG